MKVHLLPTHDLDAELYDQVLTLLRAVPGINQFLAAGNGKFMIPEDLQSDQEIQNKEEFNKIEFNYSASSEHKQNLNFPHKRAAFRWRDLFPELQEERSSLAIPEQEFLLLLTPTANRKNWFAALDENRPFNGFIHTSDWEHFINCDAALAIAFEVIALILQKNIFKSYSEIIRLAHDRAIGCVSDMCIQKSDIILKMRTADICPNCMEKLQSNLSAIEINHALSIMETLRVKMLFAQNFRQTSPPSRLKIDRRGRIFLTDYANIEIRLPAMEKALYVLFLRYPEGIYISQLSELKEELGNIYIQFATRGLRQEMRGRIKDLMENETNILNDQIRVKISRIKRAFIDAIGESLSEQYIVKGENAERKGISLERELVLNELIMEQ
jgi:hypothetical protein